MSAFSAIFKCPVRRATGRQSRQRMQGSRAAEADARPCRGATVLRMGCAGDRSSPWDGSGRGRPIRCCRPPHIGASACLRKTSGGSGGRATRPAGNRASLGQPTPTRPLCRRTPATSRQFLVQCLVSRGPVCRTAASQNRTFKTGPNTRSRSCLRSQEAVLPHPQAFQTVVPPGPAVREAQDIPRIHFVLPAQPAAQPLERDCVATDPAVRRTVMDSSNVPAAPSPPPTVLRSSLRTPFSCSSGMI